MLYGDAWGDTGRFPGPTQLECCNSSVMRNVLGGLKAARVPIGWIQIDDWWYVGHTPEGGGVFCTMDWRPWPSAFPAGLDGVQTELPWLLYAPYFCANSSYVLQAPQNFLVSPGGYAVPTPNHSAVFYRQLFASNYASGSGKKLAGYEVDFMIDNFLNQREFREELGAAEGWLAGMHTAASERNMSIQYCMALPSDLLASLQHKFVTNYRASDDYAGSSVTNFNLQTSSLLGWSLSLKPSKDAFFTTANNPDNPYLRRLNENHRTVPGVDLELNAVIATLSTGPVAFGDGPNATDRELIMRSCREDGALLQPRKPLTAIDAHYDGRAAPSGGFAAAGGAQVWTTYSEVQSTAVEGGEEALLTYRQLLSIDVDGPYHISPELDMYPAIHSASKLNHVYLWHHDLLSKCRNGSDASAGCANSAFPALDDSQRPLRKSFDSHRWSLLHVIPVLLNGFVFLGEALSKWVPVSEKRFRSVAAVGAGAAGGVAVSFEAVKGERLKLAALIPSAAGGDRWTVRLMDVECAGGVQHACFGNCARPSMTTLPLLKSTDEALAKSLVISNNTFLKDGKPFRFMAGSMHYWRNKPSEWRNKLQSMKNLGLNAVLTPTAWFWHQPAEGEWDFAGDKDVVNFVKIAGEVGLLVIVRLGSYTTAELDLGGVPYWLIPKNIKMIRSLDPVWRKYEKTYFSKMLSLLTPLQVKHGGPIACFQLGDDSDVPILKNDYYEAMKKEFRAGGVVQPINTLIANYDRDAAAKVVALNDPTTFAGLEFGVAINQSDTFNWLRETFPENNPAFNMEFYPGWIDLEGIAHTVVPTEQFVGGIDAQLYNVEKPSLSIYMAQGGTNFGWLAGGRWDRDKTTPVITSYDYNAPISEGGDEGTLYKPVQASIRKHFPSTQPPAPAVSIPKQACGVVRLDKAAALFDNLHAFAANSSLIEKPTNMEALNQGYGYLLYEALDAVGASGTLSAPGLADRGLVYAGRELVGVMGAWVPRAQLAVNSSAAPLRILVSNEGRQSGELVSLAKNSKGILGSKPDSVMKLGGKPLRRFNATSLELTEANYQRWSSRLHFQLASKLDPAEAVPIFYRGTMTAKGPAASWLLTEGWGHGIVFINGVHLGDFTCEGPGRTLYIPTGVLRTGANSVLVFETDTIGVTPAPSMRARQLTSVLKGPI